MHAPPQKEGGKKTKKSNKNERKNVKQKAIVNTEVYSGTDHILNDCSNRVTATKETPLIIYIYQSHKKTA